MDTFGTRAQLGLCSHSFFSQVELTKIPIINAPLFSKEIYAIVYMACILHVFKMCNKTASTLHKNERFMHVIFLLKSIGFAKYTPNARVFCFLHFLVHKKKHQKTQHEIHMEMHLITHISLEIQCIFQHSFYAV